jgi:hypothetical protein
METAETRILSLAIEILAEAETRILPLALKICPKY